MTRSCLLTCLFACLLLPSPAASQEPQAASEPGLDLRLDYRAMHPGEVIRVSLSGRIPITHAHLRFNGEKSTLWRDGQTGGFLAFLGLDLDLPPGGYPLVVTAQLGDGTLDTLRKEIQVIPKEFPTERLNVDAKYVTPPAEAMERIRIEAQLTRTIYAGRHPSWLGEGSFVLPTDGRVNPNFGRRRVFNDQPRSPHSGVDISSPHGTPVKASNSGRVVLARGLYYAGNTVIIDHGLGVFSIYLHFSRTLVEEGAFVSKGETIGEVGATGRVTGPHLHWSVRIRGSRVDPLSLLDLRLD